MKSTDFLMPVVNGRRIPIKELSVAFDRVKDSERWKNPICSLMAPPTDEERQIIFEAIVFYTGSLATFTPEGDLVRVEAAGYYMAIGA